MSEAVAHSGVSHHPIGLVVTDDLKRSRLTTFFRPILAIPHLCSSRSGASLSTSP